MRKASPQRDLEAMLNAAALAQLHIKWGLNGSRSPQRHQALGSPATSLTFGKALQHDKPVASGTPQVGIATRSLKTLLAACKSEDQVLRNRTSSPCASVEYFLRRSLPVENLLAVDISQPLAQNLGIVNSTSLASPKPSAGNVAHLGVWLPCKPSLHKTALASGRTCCQGKSQGTPFQPSKVGASCVTLPETARTVSVLRLAKSGLAIQSDQLGANPSFIDRKPKQIIRIHIETDPRADNVRATG